MNEQVKMLRALPLGVFTEPRAEDAWAACALVQASDSTLAETVAMAIAAPKVSLPSSFMAASFILHAPLELLARVLLLKHVMPERRADARRRIAEIAVRYAALGPEIEERPKTCGSVESALSGLRTALRAGEAAEMDGRLLFILPRVSTRRLRAALADDIAPALGAAAHTPILLAALTRFDDLNGISDLLRAPLRLIALAADQKLSWMGTDSAPTSADASMPLFQRLAAPARINVSPGNIASMMLGMEREGFAEHSLGNGTLGMSIATARQVLLRVAALSMLYDDAAHAPYGWTHCLTLPQAILDLEDVTSNPQRLVRIAATHVLGFRATLGTQSLQWDFAPACPRGRELFHVAPEEAAAVAYHAEASQLLEIQTLLATRAATHSDAHLAKYTVACLHAAIADPEASRLYLAAAAFLGAWWDAHPTAGLEP